MASGFTSFDVEVCLPLMCATRARAGDATEAEALARSWVGPNQTQVTITAQAGEVGSFALRHICWRGGQITDSGWRNWIGGRFAGGGELAFDMDGRAIDSWKREEAVSR